MITKTNNEKQVGLRKLTVDDYEQLFDYLQQLSFETKIRFGPHPFDKQSIINFYKNSDKHIGYVAHNISTEKIIAYSIIKIGYLEHDFARLQTYGINPDSNTDCTFAPSVADEWQGIGIGNALFQFILTEIKELGIKRIILWGGVQADNDRAKNYYNKNGFKTLGQFEYNGLNYDMILNIP
jgi:GNAT superfamily N-acetyltransferase